MSKNKFVPGSLVVCMDNTGLEEYGINKGQAFSVTSSIIIPGQGRYIGIQDAGVFLDGLMGEAAAAKSSVYIVEEKNFSPASVYYVRIWPETGRYEFVDSEKAKEKCPEDDYFLVSRIVLPNTEVKNMESVLQELFTMIKEQHVAKTAEVAATN